MNCSSFLSSKVKLKHTLSIFVEAVFWLPQLLFKSYMPRVKLFDEQEVLTKSMELFWKKGYHATSMDELVKFVGISRASLYGTFGGKKELFTKALAHYRTTNNHFIQQFFRGQTNVKEGLKKLFYNLIEESATDQDRKGCFVVNTTTELIPGDDEMQRTLLDNKETFHRMFYSFLHQGMQEGQISTDKDIKAIADLLYTFFNGFRVITKISTDKQELKKSVDTMLSLLD